MDAALDLKLELALRPLAEPGLVIGHRVIRVGDEHALLTEEAISFENSAVPVRRASGAVRIVARSLLQQVGCGVAAVPKSAGGAPLWPTGIVGSLAHDSSIAIAAVAGDKTFTGVGIDIEPAEDLSADLLPLVTTAHERAQINLDPYRGRLFFVAKEAVYKAVYPLDGQFLAHHDVEIDLANQRAVVNNDRLVRLKFCISTHLVALAYLRR